MGPAIHQPPLSLGGEKGRADMKTEAVSLSVLYHYTVVEVHEGWKSLSRPNRSKLANKPEKL